MRQLGAAETSLQSLLPPFLARRCAPSHALYVREVVGAAPDLVAFLQQAEIPARRVERPERIKVSTRVDPRDHLRSHKVSVPFFLTAIVWSRYKGQLLVEWERDGQIEIVEALVFLKPRLPWLHPRPRQRRVRTDEFSSIGSSDG